MKQRTFIECLRYNIEHNWNEGGLFESMTKDDCVKACNKIEQLGTKIKHQTHHIELLNQCDDSSTEVIGKMDDEIEELKAENKKLRWKLKHPWNLAKGGLE